MKKIILCLFLCLIFLSCNSSDVINNVPSIEQIDSTTTIISYSNPIIFVIDSLEFTYCITNKSGQYTTIFNEGEDFCVNLIVKNKKKRAILIPHVRNYVTLFFVRYYDRNNNSFLYYEGDTTQIQVPPYLLNIDEEFFLGHAYSGATTSKTIPSGDYYIEYQHPSFVFFNESTFDIEKYYETNKMDDEIIISNFPKCKIYFKIH